MTELNNKVLIVDDESINIMSLARILKPYYDISVAIDGKSAIKAAKKHLPAIILLDILMPDINGFDVLVQLKNSELTKDIPVIFITGLDNTEDEEMGFTLGAVDYITKPFRDSIVKARVKTHMKLAGYIRAVERLSMTDTLTELPNRRSFNGRIDSEWRRAVRENNSISVLFVDVDKFKTYNDTYGHPQGDLLLQALANILKTNLKRPSDFAARWGGEEFAILLPDTDLNGALNVAEQIRKSAEQLIVLTAGNISTRTTVSIGINTVSPTAGDSLSDFIKTADEALYDAKSKGRNRISYK